MKKIFSAFSPSGWQSVSRLGIALFLAFIVGLVLGRVAQVLAITLGVYSIVQLWNVLRVEFWLRHRRVESPPDISGVWGEVVTIISRIYRRKQFHRARVTSLLREFRRLTTAMPEGAVLLGPDHEILWFNQHAAEWLRLRRKRDLGIRVENLVLLVVSFWVDGAPWQLRLGRAADGLRPFMPGSGALSVVVWGRAWVG